MNSENTNWGQSVAGVVIKDNKELLAHHTYENAKFVEETNDGTNCEI